MKFLAVILISLVLAAPAYGAHGGFTRTAPANGEYDWKSDHVFSADEEIQIVKWTIDGVSYSPSSGLQIGPSAWHWLLRGGDYYLALPSDDGRAYSWGTNWLDRSVTVEFRWRTN